MLYMRQMARLKLRCLGTLKINYKTGGDDCPEEKCLTVQGCFRFIEKCDGVRQCQDSTDELDCELCCACICRW